MKTLELTNRTIEAGELVSDSLAGWDHAGMGTAPEPSFSETLAQQVVAASRPARPPATVSAAPAAVPEPAGLD